MDDSVDLGFVQHMLCILLLLFARPFPFLLVCGSVRAILFAILFALVFWSFLSLARCSLAFSLFLSLSRPSPNPFFSVSLLTPALLFFFPFLSFIVFTAKRATEAQRIRHKYPDRVPVSETLSVRLWRSRVPSIMIADWCRIC